jgi:ribulose-phosphate 3-epimerase
MSPLIAPSILSADFSKLGAEIKAVQQAGADWIHVDVMDGHFVPNITMGPLVVKAVKGCTTLPIDVHLMIEKPECFIEDFAQAGADWISVHAEACNHLNRTLQQIKECGCHPGVVLNPATALTDIDWVLDEIDYVLLMSVNPGFGGQKFIANSLERIRQLKKRLADRGHRQILIQVDGGVNSRTVDAVTNAGADVLVAGSAIFGSSDYKETIDRLKSAASD